MKKWKVIICLDGLFSFGLEGENHDFQSQLLVLYVLKVFKNKSFILLCLFHIKANIMLKLMKYSSNSGASNLVILAT